ncbi:hypothetical protein NW754_002626 [Fusarium falciforme]|uniref:TauD/TfdA-like domain-containing protein n=1 Tax=Fusarium falciforme TaxID=195108 RepID=A0A9W8QZ48_9HYPO|nr:hypothetical protein NW754_002626 [Fusarium falciforme]KAJ4180297.1 hypothetical protein NW755_011786 [Fusarium falciforme]
MSTTTTQTSGSTTTVKLAFDTTLHNKYKYGAYLPVYDETTTFPPLQSFEFNDRGLVANKAKSNLFPEGNSEVQVSKITPVIGTEIRGLQLSQLNDLQKDELALLIAERGVVVFRDQDFKDIGIQKQKEFGRYFGPLHIHVRDTNQLERTSRTIWSFTTSILAQITNTGMRASLTSCPP